MVDSSRVAKLIGRASDIVHAFEIDSLKIDDVYKMGDLLGSGASGKVYWATHRTTNEDVAVKIIPKNKYLRKDVRNKFLAREIGVATSSRMRHPHVVGRSPSPPYSYITCVPPPLYASI